MQRIIFHLTCLILPFTCLSTVVQAGPSEPPEALKAFALPQGLTVELVASEPLVVDPVAVSFDERGRMFVVEYRDYPLGPPMGERPLSRVKLLEDTDGDGRMDRSQVFAEGLSFAQGVMAFRQGVLVTAAPHILYLKDTDGDGKADQQEILFSGFSLSNPQLRVAHPRWGMDNKVYLTNGLSSGEVVRRGVNMPPLKMSSIDFSFDPADMTLELVSGKGQFGNTFDDFGRRFFCSNRNPVMYAPIPYADAGRNPFALLSQLYEDVAPSGGEAKVYPMTEGKTTALSHAGTHTAACGVHVFRGDALGDAIRGNVFVCEPTGSLVTQSIMHPKGTSFTVARAQPKTDFLTSTDTWFRPVSLADGPDGALYVVDMYREVIEHPQYMPAGLAETLNLRSGDNRGRIYRIRRTDASPRPFTPPKSTADLVQLLQDPIGWRRDVGQRLIVEGKRAEAAPGLIDLVKQAKDARTKLQAMYSLQGLNQLPLDVLRQALQAPEAEVREHALKLCRSQLKQHPDLLDDWHPLADDPSPRVRLQLALALGEAQGAEAVTLLAGVAGQDVEDVWMTRAVLTSAKDRAAAVLLGLLEQPDFRELGSPAKVERVADLAAVAGAQGNTDELKPLLHRIAEEKESAWWQLAALTGLAQGLNRHRGALGKTSLGTLLEKPPAALVEDAPLVRQVLSQTTGLALDKKISVAARVAAIQLLAYQPFAQVQPVLVDGLRASQPLAVQLACLDAVRLGHADAGLEIILKNWSGLSPQARTSAVDLMMGRGPSTKVLLAAMSAGRVSPSVMALDQRDRLLRSRDAEVKQLAEKLFGGQVSSNRKAVIDQYQAALSPTGDAQRGKAVFLKICAACHRISGEGHAIGPDITDVRNKARETLLLDILDPNRAVEPRWTNYVIITQDGRSLSGLLASESESGLVLRRAEGKQDVISRAEIDEIEATGKSLMPEGVEKDITPAQMSDLLEFLKAGR